MAKAKKLPSGNWRCRVSIGRGPDGKYKYKSFTASTKKEAEYMANLYLMEYVDDNDPMFKRAADDYLYSRDAVISPSTLLNYEKIRRQHFEEWEDVRLSAITDKRAQEFINRLSRGHKSKTVRNIYTLFSSIISYSCPNKSLRVKLPQKEQPTYHVPTDDQLRQMLDLASRDLKIAIMLAAFGPMRRGEVFAVEYEDITGNVVHVHCDVVEGPDGWVKKEIPKNTESDRYIDFPDEVIELIGDGYGRVLGFKTPTAITRAFERLRKKVGLNDVRFHDLRHYGASLMHAIGVPDQYIMARGGWKTDTVLKSVYRNTLQDKQNEFTLKTNGYFSENFFDKPGEDKEGHNWVRIPEYAKIHDVDQNNVWQWIVRGKLEHKIIDGKKYVDANTIPEFNENNPSRRRMKQ